IMVIGRTLVIVNATVAGAELRTRKLAPVSCSPVHTTLPRRVPISRVPLGSSPRSAPRPQSPPWSEWGSSCTPLGLHAPPASLLTPLIGNPLTTDELPPHSWVLQSTCGAPCPCPHSGTLKSGTVDEGV